MSCQFIDKLSQKKKPCNDKIWVEWDTTIIANYCEILEQENGEKQTNITICIY